MIRTTCDKCGQKYRVDETKVEGAQIKFKCRYCDHMIYLTKPDQNDQNKISAGFSFPAAEPGNASHAKSIGFFKSLQAKISLILILITAIILFGYVFINFFLITKPQLIVELNQSAETAAARLAINLIEPLWAVNEKQIDDVLSTEMRDRQISAIIVRESEDNTIFSGKSRDGRWQVINMTSENPRNDIVYQKEIKKNGDVIGSVEVHFTRRFMVQSFRKTIVNVAITAALLIISIFLALLITLRKIVIKPIQRLTHITERMSMGDMDTQIDINPAYEIGLLADSIGRMQKSLKLAMGLLVK